MLNPEKLFQLLDPTGKACDVTVVSSMELSLETDATLKRELFSMSNNCYVPSLQGISFMGIEILMIPKFSIFPSPGLLFEKPNLL